MTHPICDMLYTEAKGRTASGFYLFRHFSRRIPNLAARLPGVTAGELISQDAFDIFSFGISPRWCGGFSFIEFWWQTAFLLDVGGDAYEISMPNSHYIFSSIHGGQLFYELDMVDVIGDFRIIFASGHTGLGLIL